MLSSMRDRYKSFCIEDGLCPLKKTNFIKRLKAVGVLIDRINIGNVAYVSEFSEPF